MERDATRDDMWGVRFSFDTLLEKKTMLTRMTMTIMAMIAHDTDHESRYVGVHSG